MCQILSESQVLDTEWFGLANIIFSQHDQARKCSTAKLALFTEIQQHVWIYSTSSYWWL